MSLNWREIELILSELDLEGGLIQKVVQNSFHCVTWMIYSSANATTKALYTEVGTPYSRINLTNVSMAKTKTEKLQRFIQFARANIEGARILAVEQKKGDRQVKLTLKRQNELMYIFIRLFSGPGANIIVTDSDYRILDLLFRRPKRNEISGSVLPDPDSDRPVVEFQVRERVEGLSFNEQIDREYSSMSLESQLSDYRARVTQQKERQLSHEIGTINSLQKKMEETRDYDQYRQMADLIAANVHLIRPHQTSIEVEDYTTGTTRVIPLDPALKGAQHIQSFYEKAKRERGTFDNARSELQETRNRVERVKKYYQKALEETDDPKADLRRLKAALKEVQTSSEKPRNQVGIACMSGSFPIVIGRTARENDELLRHGFKGSDYWFHTRDCPGAYVFVKCPKAHTIPLEVMLDAANLAALYSKQKNNSKVNLYYTQVKFLRRVKNGPLGLVLPSQEKNLTIEPDRQRAQALLGTREFTYE